MVRMTDEGSRTNAHPWAQGIRPKPVAIPDRNARSDFDDDTDASLADMSLGASSLGNSIVKGRRAGDSRLQSDVETASSRATSPEPSLPTKLPRYPPILIHDSAPNLTNQVPEHNVELHSPPPPPPPRGVSPRSSMSWPFRRKGNASNSPVRIQQSPLQPPPPPPPDSPPLFPSFSRPPPPRPSSSPPLSEVPATTPPLPPPPPPPSSPPSYSRRPSTRVSSHVSKKSHGSEHSDTMVHLHQAPANDPRSRPTRQPSRPSPYRIPPPPPSFDSASPREEMVDTHVLPYTSAKSSLGRRRNPKGYASSSSLSHVGAPWESAPRGPGAIWTSRHSGGHYRTNSNGQKRRPTSPPPPRYSTEQSIGSVKSLSPGHLDRSVVESSSESEGSSNLDIIASRNARQFPPLSAASPFRSLPLKNKSSAVSYIASWVSQYEQSHWSSKQESQERSLDRQTDEQLIEPAHRFRSHDLDIEGLWQTLKLKRANLNEKRLDMSRQRKNLRALRRRRDAADNAFLSIIRPGLITSGKFIQIPADMLNKRLKDMQCLRSEYHTLESAYEDLEITLDREEEELNDVETRFFSSLASGRLVETTAPTRQPKPEQKPVLSGPPQLLLGISADGPAEDLHPLYVSLTNAIGDLENAKEEYDDLTFVKEQHDQDLELRKKPREAKGPFQNADQDDVPEELQAFVAEYPAEEARMSAAVAQYEAQVRHLRMLCEAKGVMRKHMSGRMKYLLNPQMVYADIELMPVEEIRASKGNLTHKSFPELVSQLDHLLVGSEPLTTMDAFQAVEQLRDDNPSKAALKHVVTKEHAIEQLIQRPDEDSKAEFINRWLLHQLRISSLNARILESLFTTGTEGKLQIRDTSRWQRDVLRHWWRDETTVMVIDDQYDSASSNGATMSSRRGTPPLSRAASENDATMKEPVRQVRGGGSETRTVC